MKFYNVTLEIDKMGTKKVKMSESQLVEGLNRWNTRRSVTVPTVGLIRGRSITNFSYELIVEEEVKDDKQTNTLQTDTETCIRLLDKPTSSISFMGPDKVVVGELTWENNELDFTGDATEAAKVFLKAFGDLLRSNDG